MGMLQDRKKSHTDLKISQNEFQVGEHVFVKVKPKKSSFKFGSCAKLEPTYCGPFEILESVGLVAYQLALLPNIRIHNVFHISILKKYIHDATHVIDWNLIQVELEGDFPVESDFILDRRKIFLWNRTIGQVKVQWKHLSPDEATWELESNMWVEYPNLFKEDSK